MAYLLGEELPSGAEYTAEFGRIDLAVPVQDQVKLAVGGRHSLVGPVPNLDSEWLELILRHRQVRRPGFCRDGVCGKRCETGEDFTASGVLIEQPG